MKPTRFSSEYEDVLDKAAIDVVRQADALYADMDYPFEQALRAATDNVTDDTGDVWGEFDISRNTWYDDLYETASILVDEANAIYVAPPYPHDGHGNPVYE